MRAAPPREREQAEPEQGRGAGSGTGSATMLPEEPSAPGPDGTPIDAKANGAVPLTLV